MEAPYKLQVLNMLAFPKGKQPRCELTGVPAEIECVTPHITLYYATKEHAEEAWRGIMHKIAPLLGPLRAPSVVVGSQEDRARREYTMERSKRALVDLCTQEAAKFLVSGRFDLALPGAIQALSLLKELEGEASVEMVPPYLQLAEANLGLGRFAQAEELLSRANWSILKNPDCSNALRAQLHRNFGKLYSAQGKLDAALSELAQGIYCSSLQVGPEHIDTAAGYFCAAAVFYAQHRIENALAFYDKVVDIWYKFLASIRNDADLAATLGEAQLHEAMDMLDHVLQTRTKLLGDGHIATGEAKYTLGLLNLFAGNEDAAREHVQAACATYIKHLGPDHPSTRDIQEVLSQLSSAVAPAQPGAQFEESIASHFPTDMPRAAIQSPIPLPPGSRSQTRAAEPDGM
ncbi:hypothetical protein M885DRAFT_540677 [Pelagophyceae sp. CCMP2097]|nr:hypothetical protein M885DRAFT_540677 [Pelagophyceae sp. CCMP2097]|mmetsp:Transcript_22173/g.76813  ORF Transcript_22173/g.76813 Transcript_22173/m.76813 type:complete len:403 (-) Transcript_22173:465-1673(-)